MECPCRQNQRENTSGGGEGIVGNYLQDAFTGFRNFTDAGKLLAVAAALAVYAGYCTGWKARGTQLVKYGLFTMSVCVLPPTAAVLMMYQTRFYDYQWIFSIVPLTAVIAYGGTLLLGNIWKRSKKGTALVFTGMSLFVLLCAGRFGSTEMFGEAAGYGENTRTESVQTEAFVRELLQELLQETASLDGEADCLWAPAKLLQAVRSTDTGYTLLYGRNMWDVSLNAYSYDEYPQELQELYAWMEQVSGGALLVSPKEVEEQVQKAFDQGATLVLLPIASVDGKLTDAVVLKDYYLIRRSSE